MNLFSHRHREHATPKAGDATVTFIAPPARPVGDPFEVDLGDIDGRDAFPINPDCNQSKHTACSGTAWDDEFDELTECVCACHEEAAS